MTRSGDGFGGHIAAAGAGEGFDACFGAGRAQRDGAAVVAVAEGVDVFGDTAAAARALLYGVAAGGAGRVAVLHDGIVVAEGGRVAVFGVAADGAGIGGYARVGAGGAAAGFDKVMRAGLAFGRFRRRRGGGFRGHFAFEAGAVDIVARETPVAVAAVDATHDGAENLAGGVAREIHTLGEFIARPDRRDIVAREADEIAVLVVGGGAGFAADGGRAEISAGAGAVGHGGLHHAAHIRCGVGFHGILALDGVFQNDVAVLVGDHRIAARVAHDALVDEGGEGLRHLFDGDALRELSEREGGIGVVGVALRAVVGHEARDAEALGEVFPTGGEADFVEQLRRDGILGGNQRVAYADDAGIAAGVAGEPACAGQTDIGRVVHGGVLVDKTGVDGGGIDRQRLERASGRALGLGGEVVEKVGLLLAHVASDAGNVAGLGVENHDGRAQLLARAAIGLGQVAEVLIVVIDDVLYAHIDAGVDVVAGAVDEVLGLRLGDAARGGEVADSVFENGLDIPRIDVGVLVVLVGGVEHELIGDGLFVFLVADVALLVHLAQRGVGAVLVVFGVDVGVVGGGVVGDADERGAFGGVELPDLLAEIGARCRAHAVAALAEIDFVEIPS